MRSLPFFPLPGSIAGEAKRLELTCTLAPMLFGKLYLSSERGRGSDSYPLLLFSPPILIPRKSMAERTYLFFFLLRDLCDSANLAFLFFPRG